MSYEDIYGDEDEDVSFEPDDFDGEVTDIDQMYEFDDYWEGDLVEYEFHGTGDT